MANDKTSFAKFISEYIIEIPRIQRDYVQGRAVTPEQEEKRLDFINSMICALECENNKCALDFVYGFTSGDESKKVFIPLDGQQRLTSLFLLHWYLLFLLDKNKPEGQESFDKDQSKMSLLKGHFRYNNRLSSTEFCERLTSLKKFIPIDGDIKTVITQQAWFDDEWLFDPTIDTMIEMLLSYESRLKEKDYKAIKEMATRLYETDAIYFDKLNLEDLHQGESLYIKMNARGKKLTQFENWKSKFTKMLEEKHNCEEFDVGAVQRCGSRIYKEYFSNSVEHEWNDIFWHHVTKGITWESIEDIMSKESPTVDRAFSNFLKFIHAILFFRKNGNKTSKIGDFQWTFAQNEETFGSGEKENLNFLFQYLDFLASVDEKVGFDAFFNEIFYTKTKNTDVAPQHKVRYYGNNGVNLFEKAIGYYKTEKAVINNRDDQTKFDLTDNFLLWAILSYCSPKYCNSGNIQFAVDDKLRTYIRECRNELQNIDQFLTSNVSISPDISIIDSKNIIEKLDKVRDTPKYTNSDVQDLYEWLGDFDYIGGSALAFTPILDEIEKNLSNISVKMIRDFMIAFDNASTIDRVQLLIGAGYRGKTKIGLTAGGRERYFFGEKNRWNVLFVEDANKMTIVLRKLITDFSIYTDVKSLLDFYRKQAAQNTFAYYMLNYKYALWSPTDPSSSLNDPNDGNYYFAVTGNLDDMDIIAIKISARPLNANHIDPLVCAVINSCLSSHPKITDHIKYLGRYSDKHGFSITDSANEEITDFHLVSGADGWKIEIDKNNLLSSILKEDLNLSYNKNVFELTTSQGALENDKVKIGIAVLKAIAKHYGW